jgi:hypothetical protein
VGRRTKDILVVGLVLALCYGAGWWLFGVRFTDKDIDRLVRRDLPLGSDKAKALRILDAHSWFHSNYEPPGEYLRRDTRRIEYLVSGMIYARTGNNIGSGWLSGGHVALQFAFDRRGKLIRYRVYQHIEAI